jgi:hypothetical protein
MFWLKKLLMDIQWPNHGGKKQRKQNAKMMNNRKSRRHGIIDAQGHKLTAMQARMREICGCDLSKAGLT